MRNNKKLFSLLSITLVLMFMFSSCSFSKPEGNSPSQNTNYPISFNDAFGGTTTIGSKPNTVVSLSPNITEIVYTLGVENELIGRTDYCDYPESVSEVESVGTVLEPSIEKIVSLNPDIVLTDGMQSKEFTTLLRDSGIKVVILRANESLEGTYQIISDIGFVLGEKDKSDQTINNMKQELSKISEKVNTIQNKKKVFYSVSIGTDGIYTSGKNTYINELLELCGVINVASDLEGWSYSTEKLFENNPEIIICSEKYGDKNNILNFEPISTLEAVKNKNIVEINDDLISRQGPRNIDGVKQIVEKVYNITIN